MVDYIWNISFYPCILRPLWASSEYCHFGLLPCGIAISFGGSIFTEIPQAMSIMASQNRRYIPMDYLEGEIIPGDKLFTMPSATSYEFGILMSNVHMAWTRAVCGRLKSDYSYSNMIVYNNFPWPSPTNDQKEKIRKTAQAILNARALYTDSNLADLYDPLTMPTELLKAHKANNRAVMHAYGFSIKMSEADCVAELMRMYQKLTKEK